MIQEKRVDSFIQDTCFQTPMDPFLSRCPMASSRRKSGSPSAKSMIQYGIRKAPGGEEQRVRRA